jgi:uncharacterized membrane protein
MEEQFIRVAGVAQLFSEAAAVIVVTYGSLEALLKLLTAGISPAAAHGVRKAVWRRFGMWLLLGLEFELAADIVASIVSPTWQDIGQLGAIAVIRTFLNYFLERDLESVDTSAERALDVPRERPRAAADAAAH